MRYRSHGYETRKPRGGRTPQNRNSVWDYFRRGDNRFVRHTMPTVYYEARHGIETETPDDIHTDQDPLLTLVWHYDDTADSVVQIPLNRVVRIEKEGRSSRVVE